MLHHRLLLVGLATLAVRSPAQNLRFEAEPNDTPAQANATACGVHVDGAIGVAGDRDWFSFTLTAPARVIACTGTGPGSLVTDTVVELRDAAQNLIAVNDDDNRSWMSVVSTTLPAGTFYLMVREYGNATGGYTLDLQCAAAAVVAHVPEAAEPNGPLGSGTPTALQCGRVGDGNLTNGDRDFWTFTLGARSVIRAETGRGLTGTTSNDTTVTLWDSAGTTQLAFDDDGAPGNWSLIVMVLAAGTYHLDVQGYNGVNAGTYTLLLDCEDATNTIAESAEPNGSPFLGGTPSVFACGLPGEGEINPGGDKDWWLFALPQDGFIVLENRPGPITPTAAPIGDPVIFLYDQNGGQIGSDDDDGWNLLSRLPIWLPAGTYYAELAGFGAATGSYVLRLDCGTSALFHNFVGGCPGSGSLTPYLDVREWELPLLGTTLVGEFGQCPANALVVAFAGFSRTFSGSTPLPFSLAGFGAPGCQIEVDPAATLVLFADAQGRASWPLPIPFAMSLAGIVFAQQGLVGDPGANALGFTTTNSGTGLLTALR